MKLETITKVPVERLRLDHLNPRRYGEKMAVSDEELVARLYRTTGLGESLQSISANGCMDIKPLLVLEDSNTNDGELVVLEGNQRLAALRLLREPHLAGRIASSQTTRNRFRSLANTTDHSRTCSRGSTDRNRKLPCIV